MNLDQRRAVTNGYAAEVSRVVSLRLSLFFVLQQLCLIIARFGHSARTRQEEPSDPETQALLSLLNMLKSLELPSTHRTSVVLALERVERAPVRTASSYSPFSPDRFQPTDMLKLLQRMNLLLQTHPGTATSETRVAVVTKFESFRERHVCTPACLPACLFQSSRTAATVVCRVCCLCQVNQPALRCVAHPDRFRLELRNCQRLPGVALAVYCSSATVAKATILERPPQSFCTWSSAATTPALRLLADCVCVVVPEKDVKDKRSDSVTCL